MEACVKIINTPLCPSLVFFCPVCRTTHMVFVRPPDQIIGLEFKREYWSWNGSLDAPTLDAGRNCVRSRRCHVYIFGGYAYNNAEWIEVSQQNNTNGASQWEGIFKKYPLPPISEWVQQPCELVPEPCE